jgi:uncharacterized OB-fold protein
MADTNMIKVWPLPTTDDHDAEFWAAALRGEVAVQKCGSCGKLRFPPRNMCPHCQSMEIAWQTMSGQGTIWSFCIPHPPLLPAFNDMAPYAVIVVELEDAPDIRLVGNLVDGPEGALNSVDPSTIRIGEKVTAVFAPMEEDVSLIRWVRRA